MDLNRLHGMILAPEAGDAGAPGAGSVSSGVPAASPVASPNPQPAPSPAPRVPYVPPPDDGPQPAPFQGQPGAAPQPAPGAQPAAPQDNPIPYTRVQQMLRQQEQRLRQEMQSRGPDLNQKLTLVREALKLAGIEIPDQAPQPATMEAVEQMVQQRFQQVQSQLEVRAQFDQGTRELSSAEQQFNDYFAADPGLKQRCIALWAQDGNRSMSEIVKEQISALDAFYSARTQRYASQKLADGSVVPVRPAAGLGGGARPPAHDLATNAGQDAALDELLGAEG